EAAIKSVLAAENPDAIIGDATAVDVPSSPATGTDYGVTIGGTDYFFTTDATTAEDQATVGAEIVSLLEAAGITASYDTGVITIEGYAASDVDLEGFSSKQDVSFDANDYYVELAQDSTFGADGSFDAKVLDGSNAGTLLAT